MQWNELTPIQIDALISVHIFGKTVIWLNRGTGRTAYVQDTSAIKSGNGWDHCSVIGGYGVQGTNDAGEHVEIYGHHVIDFSQNISAAWQVVERITRLPLTLEEAERAANTRFGFWFDREHLWSYSAKEAADAICKAALKAVGIAIEDGGCNE